jgi:transmembrane sensor
MPSSIKNEYAGLVQKLLHGTITADEMQVLDRYYMLFRDEPNILTQMSENDAAILEDRLQQNLFKRIHKIEKPVIPMYKRTWLRIAAVLIAGLTTALFFLNKPGSSNLGHNSPSGSLANASNHFITLPDGSQIVLRAGSKLVVDKNFTTGASRIVSLSGEAFFNVKHETKRPFIIHTGNVATTVLGTAFNIKAYPGQDNITVTVTRGRVKVEQGQKLLGILTPNKQIIAYLDSKHTGTSAQQVIAKQALAWANSDMSFEAMPFGKLAKRLEERYSVHINFKNPALEGCPITGSFNGTESLTEVLNILSQTRNTSYKVNGGDITIDGKGCNQ